MRRTTVYLDEAVDRELQALARREGRPMASVVREAVEQYIVKSRTARTVSRGFVALGRSGRSDTAERHEEILFRRAAEGAELSPEAVEGIAKPGGRPPAGGKRAATSRSRRSRRA